MSTKVGLADRVFLLQESADVPQHVAGMGIFTKPVDAPADYLQRLVAQFQSARTFAAPFNHRLRSLPLKAVAPAFVQVDDEEIDLDHHFRHNALPSPGNEQQLGALVSRLHSRPLDLRKPLWEVHLIEGLDRGRFAIYIKLHHALFDGVAGSRMLQKMLSCDPDDATVRPPWTIGREKPRRLNPVPADGVGPSDVVRRGGERLATARDLAGLVSRLVRNRVLPAGPDVASPYQVPKTILNGRVGRQRSLATQTFDFERVRAVADRAEVTVNDVFLSICAGGLRRYLAELDALPPAGLVAGTPVSLRSGPTDATNNAFTITTMNLRTDLADPLERIRAINRSSEQAKKPFKAVTKAAAENYGALFVSPYILQNLTGLGGRMTPPYNLIASNVPGPLETQYLAGSRLESMVPLALLSHGQALFIAALTISGTMSIGFVGDRDTLPNLQSLADHTAAVLEELEEALVTT